MQPNGAGNTSPVPLPGGRVTLLPHAGKQLHQYRASSPVLSMWPCKLIFDEEKSKHSDSAQQNSFGPAFSHSLLSLEKAQQRVTPTVDWLDSLIAISSFKYLLNFSLPLTNSQLHNGSVTEKHSLQAAGEH
jgi:hypothetical protein